MKLNIPGLDLALKFQMHPAREKRGSFQKLYQSSRVVKKWFLSRLKKSRRDTKLDSQLTRSPFISSAWSVQREPWKKEKRQVRNTEWFHLVIRVGFKLGASSEIASQVQSSLFPACEMCLPHFLMTKLFKIC